jgi:S1-C subfamily serine protease
MLDMRSIFHGSIGALLALLMLAASAFADPLIDRSTLSVDENVSINTACFAAHLGGDRAFNRCVDEQVAQLKDHPTPDRSRVSTARLHRTERDCNYLRRVGIGQYNDCLRQGFAGLFGEAPAKRATPVMAAALPDPHAVLAARPARAGGPAMNPAEVYKKVERSVYVVVAATSLADAFEENIVLGSGVAVSDRLLLTNCHVVMDHPVIRIVRDDEVGEATLVGGDRNTDRCIIKSSSRALMPVPGVRAYKDLAVGERVFAVGTPHALERTLSEGLVSGLRQHAGIDMVQTTAPLSPGSSGGGLFDDRGNLIGITTLASIYGAQNLNFAIAASAFWQ